MRTLRHAPLAVALLLSAVGGGAFYLLGPPFPARFKPTRAPDQGGYTSLAEPRPWPAVDLMDTEQDPIRPDRLRGKPWWVFLGYAKCRTMCPTVLSQAAEAQRAIEERGAEPPTLLFVSLDPSDADQDVAKFVSTFGDNLIGATGQLDEIHELARTLDTSFRDDPSAPGEILHSGAIFVLNDRAEVVGRFSPPHDLDTLALAGEGQ